MLRKHVTKFWCAVGCIFVRFVVGYRNIPHSATGEKPSFLLFDFDCRHPTEAATLPTKLPSYTDYREELVLFLSSAKALAKKLLHKAKQVQKAGYNKHATPSKLRVG